MGDSETSRFHRMILNEKLAKLTKKWEGINISRKNDYIEDSTAKSILSTGIFAVIGGIIAGPPGALLGGALGGGSKAALSYGNSC